MENSQKEAELYYKGIFSLNLKKLAEMKSRDL